MQEDKGAYLELVVVWILAVLVNIPATVLIHPSLDLSLQYLLYSSDPNGNEKKQSAGTKEPFGGGRTTSTYRREPIGIEVLPMRNKKASIPLTQRSF